MAHWITFSLINYQQPIYNFTKHLLKQQTYKANKKTTLPDDQTSQLKQPNSQQPFAAHSKWTKLNSIYRFKPWEFGEGVWDVFETDFADVRLIWVFYGARGGVDKQGS